MSANRIQGLKAKVGVVDEWYGMKPFLSLVDQTFHKTGSYDAIKATLEPDEMLITEDMLEESPELFDIVDSEPIYLLYTDKGLTVATNPQIMRMEELSGGVYYRIVRRLFLVKVRENKNAPCGVYNLTFDEYFEMRDRYQVLKMSAKVIPLHMNHTTEIIPIEEYRAKTDYYELIEILVAVRFKLEREMI